LGGGKAKGGEETWSLCALEAAVAYSDIDTQLGITKENLAREETQTNTSIYRYESRPKRHELFPCMDERRSLIKGGILL